VHGSGASFSRGEGKAGVVNTDRPSGRRAGVRGDRWSLLVVAPVCAATVGLPWLSRRCARRPLVSPGCRAGVRGGRWLFPWSSRRRARRLVVVPLGIAPACAATIGISLVVVPACAAIVGPFSVVAAPLFSSCWHGVHTHVIHHLSCLSPPPTHHPPSTCHPLLRHIIPNMSLAPHEYIHHTSGCSWKSPVKLLCFPFCIPHISLQHPSILFSGVSHPLHQIL